MVRHKFTKSVFLFVSFLLLSISIVHAEKGYLYVTSTPDSATLIIDGLRSDRYFTPVLCTLSVGPHEITITKKYHTTQTFSVTVRPEAVTRQTFTFEEGVKETGRSSNSIIIPSKYGQLTFISEPLGALVIADGEELDVSTPTTLYDIPAGKHNYSIVYQFLKYDTTIEITGDSPQTAIVDFDKFVGDDIYSIMPHVKTKVVIVVPGCEYKLDDSTGQIMIKGVDAEIRIRTGDTSLTLTHKELADFPTTSGENMAKLVKLTRLPQTEYTYIFEPYIDAQIKFDANSFTSKNKFVPKDSAHVHTSYHQLPASLNSGNEINVRINIEAGGGIIVRYW